MSDSFTSGGFFGGCEIIEDTKKNKSNEKKYKSKLICKKIPGNKGLLYNAKGKRMRFSLKNVFLKHGLENYNEHMILNIYVSKDVDSNEEYNKVIDMVNVTKNVKNMPKVDKFEKRFNLKGKTFTSPIKEEKDYGQDVFIIRTYLNHKGKILMDSHMGIVDVNYNVTDLTDYKANVELTIKTLWTTNNNFGIIIYTDEIKLLNKVSTNH